MKEWSCIYIVRSEWERLRVRHSAGTWERFRSVLEVVPPPIMADIRWHHASVWWVSGSWEYIDSLQLPNQVGQVYWLRHQIRRWPRFQTPIDWKQLTHAHVGGSTNARGIFGTRFLPQLEIPRDLQRSLNHVIKFSIRPLPCPPDFQEPHYSLHDRLSIQQVFKPVPYSTFFLEPAGANAVYRPLNCVHV